MISNMESIKMIYCLKLNNQGGTLSFGQSKLVAIGSHRSHRASPKESVLVKLGMRSQWLQSSLDKLIKTALRASYVIWLARKCKKFTTLNLSTRRVAMKDEAAPYSINTSSNAGAVGCLSTVSRNNYMSPDEEFE